MKFHDGNEMTSEDVVFSFGPERLTGQKAPGFPMVRRYWVSLDKVEAVDRYTVRFTSKYQDPIFEQRLAAWTAQIISKAAYLKASSCEAIVGKPSEAMTRFLLQRLKADPSRCLLVGDRLEMDILMANNAGIASALVLTGATSIGEIEGSAIEPTYILSSLVQILRARD